MSLLYRRMKRGNTRKERRGGKGRKKSEGSAGRNLSRNLSFRGSNVLKLPFRSLTAFEHFFRLQRGWRAIRKLDNPRESASNSAQIDGMETETVSRYRLRKQTCNRLAGREASWCLITPEIPSNVPETLGAFARRNPAVYSPSAVLAIPTSETIYSRAIAKSKKLHLIPRETVCFNARIQRINFDFQAPRAHRSEICNVEVCERKILLSCKYFMTILSERKKKHRLYFI